MMQGRIVALDVGDVRIGIAVCDEMRLIATPHSVYKRVGFGPDVKHIKALCDEMGTHSVLCGLPRNMDGSVGFQAEKVQRFMQVLIDQGVPVAWMDERLTTVSAQRALIEGGVRREERKKSVDKVAAAVILQAWLDNAQNVKEYNEMANDEIRRPDEEPETDEVPDVVELTDEDGNTTRFEYITTLDQDGELYIALMPIEDEENADDENGYVVFMKIEQDENGEDYYVSIDDDDLVDALFEKLTQMLDEEE